MIPSAATSNRIQPSRETLKIALSLAEDAFIKQGVLVTCHESWSAFLGRKRLVFSVAKI
jgi:hypothetical protein